ncbi:protein-glutamate methylesterase/protein-glutamine glutaminase [Planctomicrobium sp. SH664]|uniref:protein-glutamate methylesterase/protein-glutamine glutaminase n=1 Tax=Planctomicrobium sp. SH664 TaxID=3448125 RepID=UPI003F5B10DF
MSRPIRIFLADDSLVIRRILVQALSRHRDLLVVGVARNGAEAVATFQSLQPDVVLLDVEMPEMNGVEAVAGIRRLDRTLPIVMFSSLTVEGGHSTLDAIAQGANDYVTKPRNVVNLAQSLDLIDSELVTKIRFWGEKRIEQQEHPAPTHPAPTVVRASLPPAVRVHQAVRRDPVEVVVIGVSTGGPNALAEVLPAIPRTFGVPIVIVQHMPPVFTQLLANRLNDSCPCPVREAVDGEPLIAGQVLIAPGNWHVRIVRRDGEERIQLDDGLPVNSCRPAVDVLFQSAAELYGAGVLAAVLTGMGKDGLEGAKLVRERGGRIIAQDQETSVVWGMPRAVTEAGLAHQVLALRDIAPEILRSVAAAPLRIYSSPQAR